MIGGLPSSVAILGSTGSVGVQAIDVAIKNNIPVDLIAAKSNVERLEEEIRLLKPRLCAVTDPKAAQDLSIRVKDTNTRIYAGDEGLFAAIQETVSPVVVNAIIGEAGLLPTLAVIKAGKRLALSNKESLVIAGEIVMREAKAAHTEIIPVDSEHSAIFQSLLAGRASEVRRILLTASGGPFFNYSKEQLAGVTLADTLRHPTWKMGKKITVDCATMMNKGFEVIEAVHLFGVAPEQIEVLIHRESIMHSAVEYIDNSIIAQMSVPDMRHCVQYALTHPTRTEAVIEPLDFTKLGSMTFAKPDTDTFSLLALAKEAIKRGGAYPAVLNAANEVAVAAFLNKKLSFTGIFDVVTETFEALSDASRIWSVDDIFAFDGAARSLANEFLEKRSNL